MKLKKFNHYGVIAVKISVDVLDELDCCDILITKDNPIGFKAKT